jgi:uncharacterized protein (DUF433 family)
MWRNWRVVLALGHSAIEEFFVLALRPRESRRGPMRSRRVCACGFRANFMPGRLHFSEQFLGRDEIIGKTCGRVAMATISESAISKHPNILGGEPVFRGTRVPFKVLTDYLEGGDTLDQFLEEYPSVSRELAVAAIEEARLSLIAQLK